MTSSGIPHCSVEVYSANVAVLTETEVWDLVVKYIEEDEFIELWGKLSESASTEELILQHAGLPDDLIKIILK